MAESTEPTDLIVSYIIRKEGIAEGTDRELKEALAKGYRVVHITTSVVKPEGGPKSDGWVAVTVLLTKQSSGGHKFYGKL